MYFLGAYEVVSYLNYLNVIDGGGGGVKKGNPSCNVFNCNSKKCFSNIKYTVTTRGFTEIAITLVLPEINTFIYPFTTDQLMVLYCKGLLAFT